MPPEFIIGVPEHHLHGVRPEYSHLWRFARLPSLPPPSDADQLHDIVARLLAVETDSIGANQCLTTLPSISDPSIYYMHLATCGDDISPPPSQAFLLYTGTSGHEIFYVRAHHLFSMAYHDFNGYLGQRHENSIRRPCGIRLWSADHDLGDGFG